MTGAHCWLLLMKAYRAVESYDHGSIAQTGICFGDFACLEALLHKGPLPVNEIGRLIQRTSGSMTALVDRLSQRGWLQRIPHPEDRRVQLVELTPAGKQWIEGAFEAHRLRLERLFEDFSPEQRHQLGDLLRKLGKRAQQLHRPAQGNEE